MWVKAMYYRNDQDQLSMEEFSLSFGGRLLRDNRWVRPAGLIPWEYIEEIYAQNMSGKTDCPAISSRIAFGAIFTKEYCHITERIRWQICRKTPICNASLDCMNFIRNRCLTHL